MRVSLMLVAGCAATVELGPPEVSVDGFAQVVPGPGLPAEAELQAANNNLDIVRHDGRIYLAWRTAPSHFASDRARMHVVSSADEQTWRFEGSFHVGRDVREPQLVPADDGLWLYFAQLGTSSFDFEPGGVLRSRQRGPGDWTEPEPFGPEGFIAWRIKQLDGRWHMFGYVGGGEIYATDGDPVTVHWLQSDDGVTWPEASDDTVVLVGGGSETDAVFLDDGSLVAVTRNEAGDDDGFGSKVCTAPAGDLTSWTCAADPRKYDSPMVVASGGRVWLVARRTLSNDGLFDLGQDELSAADQYLAYQGAYWNSARRCAIWQVEPAYRSVTWMQDLPSKGDTCFPEAVADGEDAWILYNYSSDPDGPDMGWLEGQGGPTNIYRQRVTLR